jgi:hypothetical protein
MAETGDGVDIVGPDNSSHEFLEQVVLFIGASGRGNTAYGIGTVSALDLLKALDDVIVSLIPRCRNQFPVLAHHRFGDSVGMVNVLVTKPSLAAEEAVVVGSLIVHTQHVINMVTLDLQVKGASHPAEGAGGPHRSKFPRWCRVLEDPAVQGAHRACLDTLAAELTVHGPGEGRLDNGGKTSAGKIKFPFPLNLIADPDATAA